MWGVSPRDRCRLSGGIFIMNFLGEKMSAKDQSIQHRRRKEKKKKKGGEECC